MSRIGRLPVAIPQGVSCDLSGQRLKVKGPKGALECDIHPEMKVAVSGGEVAVARPSDRPDHRALHGLTRALIQNMIVGVTKGYERVLRIEGTGYRASMQGKTLNLSLGYSHPLTVEPPDGVSFVVEGTQVVKVAGIDKQLVGQTAANIRALRKPEPYKGKGVRFDGEQIRRKVGKSAGK